MDKEDRDDYDEEHRAIKDFSPLSQGPYILTSQILNYFWTQENKPK